MPTPEELAAAQAVLDAAKNEEERVEFDTKQQAKVVELIKKAKSEAAKDLRNEHAALQAEEARLKAELEQAKADLASASSKGGKPGSSEDVEAKEAEINELKTIISNTKNEAARYKAAVDSKGKEVTDALASIETFKRDVAIRDAALDTGFIDPSEVAEFTAKFVKFDPEVGRYVVVENGTTRMNNALEPMTLAEFYKEYAEKKPYLVRSDAKGGAGSKASERLLSGNKHKLEDIFGPKSDSRKAQDLNRQNPALYKQMKAQAVSEGLLIL